MPLADYFTEFMEVVQHKPTVRKFYQRLPDDQVLPEFTGREFHGDQGYFQIKLAEMFLKDRREYWQEFLPLGLVLSGFSYLGEEKKAVPFLVGHNLLAGLEQYVQGEAVEYHNTEVTKPIPYRGGGLELFVGLCAIEVNDLVKRLIDCLDNVVQTLAVPPLSTYLKVAAPLYQGVKSFLGLKEVRWRFGHRDIFTDKENDPQRFRSGYLAFINCPEETLTVKNLWVKEDRLYKGPRNNQRHLDDYDYCLIKIEHLARRQDYESLPCFALWQEARKILWERDNQALAMSKMNEFFAQVALSPDLTRSDAHQLILLYKANFDSEVSAYQAARGLMPPTMATVSRSASGLLDPAAVWQKTAHLAEKAGFSRDTVKGLRDLSAHWGKIPYLKERPPQVPLTAAQINEQLAALDRISSVQQPDPVALAEAIAVASLSATEKG